MTVLAVITARAGSKRLPGKNKRIIAGKPLFQWTVAHAKASKLITDIVMTSDDEEILSLCGVRTIKRPAELSQDDSPSVDAVLHALDDSDYVVLLQPTSPMRYTIDIDACIRGAMKHGSCVSTFHGKPNGAAYAIRSDLLKERRSFYPAEHYEMPGYRSIDIDTEADFIGAEYALLEDMYAVA